jgi:hypothetical protein
VVSTSKPNGRKVGTYPWDLMEDVNTLIKPLGIHIIYDEPTFTKEFYLTPKEKAAIRTLTIAEKTMPDTNYSQNQYCQFSKEKTVGRVINGRRAM